jgi:phosphatidylserine/phosphatidylglycerophosphate/cardiolipin synthase-like enzyme
MITTSNKDQIYIGRKAGEEILRTISNAKESVKIVSPYLSSSYIMKLVNLEKKGIKITLITCDELKEDTKGFSNFKLSDIIKQKKIKNIKAKSNKRNLLYLSLLLFLIALIGVAMTFVSQYFIFIAGFFFITSLSSFSISFFIKDYKSEYYSIFKLKIFDSHSSDKPWSTNLIHSKIFIIDEKVAFLGSANFTYSGFNTHYETVIKIEDINAIKSISNEIENLYNSKDLKSKSIEELGKQIYL